MEYLVNVGGEVTDVKSTVYTVNAKSEQEAQQIAKDKFKEEFNAPDDFIYVQHPRDRVKKGVAACVFMVIAIIIACIPFQTEQNFIQKLFHQTPESINLAPGLKMAFLAIVIYSGWIVRFKGIQNTVKSKLDILMCVCSIVLLSTLLGVIVGKDVKIFFIVNGENVVFTLLFLTAIFSWTKAKLATAVCMGLTLLISLTNIQIYDEAMGIWGAVYVICAYLGILLHLSVEPQVLEALPYIKNSVNKGVCRIKKSFSQASDEIRALSQKNSDDE